VAAAGFEPATNTLAITDFCKINELGELHPAHLSLKNKQALPTRSYFTEAITTVYGFVPTWLEWYLGFLATIGAYCREHLSRWAIAVSITTIAIATVSVPLCFPCLTTFRATFGLVSIASSLEKLLFVGTEGEFTPTIGTFKRLVFESHWMTSSLSYLVRVLVIQYSRQNEMFSPLCNNQYLLTS